MGLSGLSLLTCAYLLVAKTTLRGFHIVPRWGALKARCQSCCRKHNVWGRQSSEQLARGKLFSLSRLRDLTCLVVLRVEKLLKKLCSCKYEILTVEREIECVCVLEQDARLNLLANFSISQQKLWAWTATTARVPTLQRPMTQQRWDSNSLITCWCTRTGRTRVGKRWNSCLRV